MKLVFVTGTDTDVGKTHVAAALTRAWDANYWKPIQTGTTSDPGDTTTVQTLTRLPNARFCRPQVELEYPLSPWRASLKEGLVPVKVSDIEIPDEFNISPRPLVIEGAGGLMVPINEKEIMTDLIIKFKSPVILVARSGLGTLNHTLLSIEHLRYKGVRDIYVVFNGPLNKDNQEAVEAFAPDVKILACIPPCENGIEGLVEYIPSIEFLRV
ncbi:CIC11C00000005570 [Sungouiella intermedia]|uniref:CIC11C00000005570 n=1 Tax=Sungouiella intermedia TaxID=45354 RepID=A0A1L0B918_9ASCO|nr:CIC11C00000005570 [[Candida] intermedia]